eukprot:PhM_4_TR2047/c0_g1_i1/m.46069
MSSSLSLQQRALRTGRDAFYMAVALPKRMMYALSVYNDFHRYLHEAGRNRGKVRAENFRGSDMTTIRQMVRTHEKIRGPVTNIDLRWFWWFYGFIGVYFTFFFFKVYRDMEDKSAQANDVWEERRQLPGDYEEPLRR